jgi:hypothetical protein
MKILTYEEKLIEQNRENLAICAPSPAEYQDLFTANRDEFVGRIYVTVGMCEENWRSYER